MVAVQEVDGGGSGRLDCGSCQTRIIILGLMAPVPLHCSNLLCYVSQVFAAGMCVFGSCIRNPLYCTLHVTVNPIISLSPNNQNQPTASSNTRFLSCWGHSNHSTKRIPLKEKICHVPSTGTGKEWLILFVQFN